MDVPTEMDVPAAAQDDDVVVQTEQVRGDADMPMQGMEIDAVTTRPCGSVGSRLPSTDDDSQTPEETAEDTHGEGRDSKPSAAGTEEEHIETELREVHKALTKDMRDLVRAHNDDILSLIKSLGGDSKRYQRERRRGLQAVVSEIYSPPRVTAATKLLPELGCVPGFALDLTTVDAQGRPWDFDDADTRMRARAMVEQEKPLLLVGSPMCRAYSAWQRLNAAKRDPAVVARELVKAKVHLAFCMELYEVQRSAGRYFLHEHPAQASSWQEDVVQAVEAMEGVFKTTVDQCQYGMEDEDGSPMRKPTTFMTNSACLVESLNKRCGGRGGSCTRPTGGRHVVCNGRRARMAAIYHFKLCKAILVGFRNQMVKDNRCKSGFVGLTESFEDEPDPLLHIGMTEAEVCSMQESGGEEFRDDVTGQLLRPDLVREARRKELEYFAAKGVWVKRPIAEAREKCGKPPITIKWVDTNKGDDLVPNIRSRLVAREIRRHGEEAIFAPTPPLESLRTIMSLAATDLPGRVAWCRDGSSEERCQVGAFDIS